MHIIKMFVLQFYGLTSCGSLTTSQLALVFS